MNYIAITEVRPIEFYIEKTHTEWDTQKIIDEIKLYGLQPIDSFKKEPLKCYTNTRLSEETFKFIESIATIYSPSFGEKEYKINDLKFQIYTEEEYEKRYGKPDLTVKE